MTLRLTETETAQLREQAEVEDRSMQDVARSAVREYVHRHNVAGRVSRSIEETLPAFDNLFRRLGDA